MPIGAVISVITGLMPLIKTAADVVSSFQGDDKAARADKNVQDALDVISAVAPILETFAQGGDVTQEDVRRALAGYDRALNEFDAEIARQSQGD